jgi:hypothetical protein
MSLPTPPNINQGQIALDPVNGIVYYKDNEGNLVATTWSWLRDGLSEVSTNDNVTITGDLVVEGETVTVNASQVLVEDNIITLNSTVTGAPVLDAGIEVERGTDSNVFIRWNETTNKWEFTNDGSNYGVMASLADVGIETGVGIETEYAVQGGTAGTQPTFNGNPLFTATYIIMSSNLVHFQIQVDMDNITSFGTGQYYMTLPFVSKYGYKFRDGCLHDANDGKTYHISGHVYAGSDVITLYTTDISGQNLYDFPFAQGEPITLATADNFHVAGTYIADI